MPSPLTAERTSGFAPVLVLWLALLAVGASQFGVIYELAQYQLRDHPETWMLANPGSDDVAVRRMRTDVLGAADAFGVHWSLAASAMALLTVTVALFAFAIPGRRQPEMG